MNKPENQQVNADSLPKTADELKQIISSAVEEVTKKKSKPAEPENKPSLSFSAIAFVILTAVVGGLVGYFADYFIEVQKKDKYALQIAYQVGENLIAWDKYAREKVTVSYKSEFGKELVVRSYFSIRGKVLNSGNKKFQNLMLHFSSDKDLFLIKIPQFTVFPKRERPYLEMRQNIQNTNNEDEWTFTELRPDEHIEFHYLAFSEKTFENPQIAIVPKEPKDKEYNVSYQEKIDAAKEKRKSFLKKSIQEFTGFDILLIVFVSMAPFLYLLFFYSWFSRIKWKGPSARALT